MKRPIPKKSLLRSLIRSLLHGMQRAEAFGRGEQPKGLLFFHVSLLRERFRPWVFYGTAVVTTGATLLLLLAFRLLSGEIPPVVLFTIPIFLSSLSGGVGPGLTATALSALFTHLFLFPSATRFALPSDSQWIQLWGVMIAGGMVSLLSEIFYQPVLSNESGRPVHSVSLRSIRSASKALLEQSMAGIYVIQNSQFRYVNPAFASIFGYDSPGEIIGRVMPPDLVAPGDRKSVEEKILLRLQGDQDSLQYSFRGLRRDGKEIFVEVHGSSFLLKGARAIIGVLLDVSERTRLENSIREYQQQLEELVKARTEELKQALERVSRSEERYRILFDNSKIPMLLIDPVDGSLVEANGAACSYYGYSRQELIRLKIQQINQLPPGEVEAEMRRAREEKRNHFYFLHRLADGSLRDVEVHSGPLEIGGRKLLYSVIHDITDRRDAERNLKELNRDFLTLLENTSDFIYFKDKDSRFRFCSQTLARITGHTSWREMVGKHDLEVFPPETAWIYYTEEIPIFREAASILNRVDPYYDENGKRGWVSTNKWPVLDEDGRTVVGLFGISRDITIQHEAEERLKIAASVFQSASEGILITDVSGSIIEANDAFSRITGYSREAIIGRNPRFLKSGHHDKPFFDAMWKSLLQSGFWQGVIWNRRKDGGLFACRTAISAVKDRNGEVTRFIGLHSDVTEFLERHEELEHMAYYDTLTQLPNRVLLSDRMNQSMAQADRNQTAVAVCYLDLDGFKPVNDRFGHKAGDLLLVEIANRLKSCVRAEDTVARIGGDEFILLLTQLKEENEWRPVVDRVLVSVRSPFVIPQEGAVNVSASIGISVYPGDHTNGEQLIRYADLAMYNAKDRGRDLVRLYRDIAGGDSLPA